MNKQRILRIVFSILLLIVISVMNLPVFAESPYSVELKQDKFKMKADLRQETEQFINPIEISEDKVEEDAKRADEFVLHSVESAEDNPEDIENTKEVENTEYDENTPEVDNAVMEIMDNGKDIVSEEIKAGETRTTETTDEVNGVRERNQRNGTEIEKENKEETLFDMPMMNGVMIILLAVIIVAILTVVIIVAKRKKTKV